MLAGGAFNVAGLTDVFGLYFEVASLGWSACWACRGMAHNTSLDSGHLGANGAVHMLEFCHKLMAAVAETPCGKCRDRKHRVYDEGEDKADQGCLEFHKVF